MLESITTWLIGVISLLGVSFATPEPEQPPIALEPPAEEIQSVTVTPPEVVKPVEEPPKAKPVDVYCTQNAFRYSESKYKDKSQEPKGAKNECQEDNNKALKGHSLMDLKKGKDCDQVKEEAEKEFERWKEEYTEYKNRCS